MNQKDILRCAIGLLAIVNFTSCNDTPDSMTDEGVAATETAVEHAKKHLDPNYVCPMHPQIVRDKPGSCPICGMDLVKKEVEDSSSSTERKILYWVAPMDPNYRRDKPGKSPMGMDLVPVYDEGGGEIVKIAPEVVNNLGVRSSVVKRGNLWRKIETVGYVDFDENRISHIHMRTKGWIERLLVRSEGERVNQGQLLFEFYSPELVNAQEEMIQALKVRSRGLTQASEDKLISLGMSKRQLDRLIKTKKVEQLVRVYASQDGIIAALKVREGMFVMPQAEVMSLADLSSVWLLAEIFERQADWVEQDQPAEVRLSFIPGRTWEGAVEYVYPSLDRKTRTLKARLRFDNPEEALKPNMYAAVTIYAGPEKNVVSIPREALIRTGESERVILDLGKGRYQARIVQPGIESGDWVEIQSGLDEGDRVVTSAQFLIDSEASIKASLKRMAEPMNEKAQEKVMEPKGKLSVRGVLKNAAPGENKINVQHEPIPALGWPAMTMDFKLADGVSADAITPDSKVEFELEDQGNGYVITSIKKSGE